MITGFTSKVSKVYCIEKQWLDSVDVNKIFYLEKKRDVFLQLVSLSRVFVKLMLIWEESLRKIFFLKFLSICFD